MPGFLVHHQLLEHTQTHVHSVSGAIQPAHPLSPPCPTFNLFKYQSIFKSQFFASDGQRFGSSASASILPMNVQNWFPLELTDLILLSKRHSRVFSNTSIQKQQFFGSQPSLLSKSHICPSLLYLKWITKKNLLYSTRNSVQRYMWAWMGGEFRGELTHVCVWLNCFTVHLKLLQHC